MSDVVVLPLSEIQELMEYWNTKVPSKYAITTLTYFMRKIQEQHPIEAIEG